MLRTSRCGFLSEMSVSFLAISNSLTIPSRTEPCLLSKVVFYSLRYQRLNGQRVILKLRASEKPIRGDQGRILVIRLWCYGHV